MINNQPVNSRTYKFETPGISEHKVYFTIVGDEQVEALFVNSKEMNAFQWITALMTSYSQRLRNTDDYDKALKSIIDDMKETFDPRGGYIIPDGSGRKVHSVVHHLGLILEQHNATV